MVVRKQAHEHINGFDPKLTFCEDADYAQRLVRNGKKFGILPGRIIFDMSRFKNIGRVRFIKIHIWNAIHYVLTGESSPEMKEVYRRNRAGNAYKE